MVQKKPFLGLLELEYIKGALIMTKKDLKEKARDW